MIFKIYTNGAQFLVRVFHPGAVLPFHEERLESQERVDAFLKDYAEGWRFVRTVEAVRVVPQEKPAGGKPA